MIGGSDKKMYEKVAKKIVLIMQRYNDTLKELGCFDARQFRPGNYY